MLSAPTLRPPPLPPPPTRADPPPPTHTHTHAPTHQYRMLTGICTMLALMLVRMLMDYKLLRRSC